MQCCICTAEQLLTKDIRPQEMNPMANDRCNLPNTTCIKYVKSKMHLSISL